GCAGHPLRPARAARLRDRAPRRRRPGPRRGRRPGSLPARLATSAALRPVARRATAVVPPSRPQRGDRRPAGAGRAGPGGGPRLDDAALEALAEAYTAPPPAHLRARVLAEARRDAAARASAAMARWRLVGSAAAAVALVFGGLLARETRIAATRAGEVVQLAD